MRRRLYFVLPNMTSAQEMMNEMLLARIEESHIHFLAKRGTLPDDLPEANVLQKTDIVHGAIMGMVIGGVAGVIGGTLVVVFPPEGVSLQLVTILITSILGAMFGTWVSSMAASAVPNSKLKVFHPQVEQGKVLMMVDVPLGKVELIRNLVETRHPEAASGGMEATMPAFP